ncbi:MAG: PAAR domain-containing protein [Myxococcales bacterium]|nr:PAAR domain-containing protein [Myxococcales bacterium]
MFPAARVDDLLVPVPPHAGKVATGSPDTVIAGKAAARLQDLTSPCPPPPTGLPTCQPPLGRIVKSSSTVFINRLGAARAIVDAVKCGAGASPPGPGGCRHPPATGYAVRDEDHYHRMMKGEHEQPEWDAVGPVARGPLDGQRPKVGTPIGITGGAARPSVFEQPEPGGVAYPVPPGDSPNPHAARAIPPGALNHTDALQGGDYADKSVSFGAAGHELGLHAKRLDTTPETLARVAAEGRVAAERRAGHVTVKLNLLFALDLSFGQRSGSAASAVAPAVIAPPTQSTVFIG